MKSIEQRYEEKHIQPTIKQRLPTIDKEGKVNREFVDESSESRNEFDDSIPTDIEHYVDYNITRSYLAEVCSKVQLNNDDAKAVQELVQFIKNLENYVAKTATFSAAEVADLEAKLETSLEILISSAVEGGPLAQIAEIMEVRLQKKLRRLIRNVLNGDEQCLEQLLKRVKDDQLCEQYLTIAEELYQILKKCKYNVRSDIIFSIFDNLKVSAKIQDFIPNLSKYNRHNAKYRVDKKVLGKKAKKDKLEQEKQLFEHQKEHRTETLIENQQGLMALLFVMCSSIIKDTQRSLLLSRAIQLVKRFQPYLNEQIYADIAAVCRQYLYGYFFERSDKFYDSLLKLVGEEPQVSVFSVSYNKAYSIVNDVNFIRQTVKDEQLILYCDQPFEILLQCALLATTVHGDTKVVLLWLIGNLFRVNEDNIDRVLYLFGRSMDTVDRAKAVAFYQKIKPIIDVTKFDKFIDNQVVRSSEARIAKMLGPEWD